MNKLKTQNSKQKEVIQPKKMQDVRILALLPNMTNLLILVNGTETVELLVASLSSSSESPPTSEPLHVQKILLLTSGFFTTTGIYLKIVFYLILEWHRNIFISNFNYFYLSKI